MRHTYIIFLYFAVELIQTHPQMFSDAPPRRLSDSSVQSTVSGLIDNIPLTTITTCKFIAARGGCSRSEIDYI